MSIMLDKSLTQADALIVAPIRRSIRLTEWESQELQLNPSHVDDLLRCPDRVLRLQMLPGGRTLLKPQSFVGQIRVGSVDLRILPKCPVPSLLAMLAEVYELAQIRPDLVGFEKTDEIVDLLIQMFLLHADRVVLQGLKRTYVQEEQQLVSVRGRIDVRQTIDLHLRGLPRVHCRYEDYTLDCPENRLLLAALRAVAGNPAVAVHRRDVAHRLTGDFWGVKRVPTRTLLENPPTADRLNPHYSPALELAAMVLRCTGILQEFGEAEANGFLINMNTLFERFVFRRLGSLLGGHRVRVRDQVQVPFDQAAQCMIRPDLLIDRPGGRRLVADTKYKIGVDSGPGDLYQMLAYCRILKIRWGMLIRVGRGTPRQFRIRDGETTIEVVALDINGTVDQVNRSMKDLSRFIRNQMSQ